MALFLPAKPKSQVLVRAQISTLWSNSARKMTPHPPKLFWKVTIRCNRFPPPSHKFLKALPTTRSVNIHYFCFHSSGAYLSSFHKRNISGCWEKDSRPRSCHQFGHFEGTEIQSSHSNISSMEGQPAGTCVAERERERESERARERESEGEREERKGAAGKRLEITCCLCVS